MDILLQVFGCIFPSALYPLVKALYKYGYYYEIIDHLCQFHNQTFSQLGLTLSTLDLTNPSKLEPQLSDADTFDLIKTSTDCLFKLPAGLLVPGKGKEEAKEEQVRENETLIKASFKSLHDLLEELLRKDLTSQGFLKVFKVSCEPVD